MSSTKRSNDREIQTVEIPFFTQHRGERVRAGGVTNLKGFQAAKLHPRVRKKRPLLRGFGAAGHATSHVQKNTKLDGSHDLVVTGGAVRAG